MPHVVVKLWPGKSEKKKAELAAAITREVTAILSYGDESVSVSMEEIGAEQWMQSVFQPVMQGRMGKIYKKPGYDSI